MKIEHPSPAAEPWEALEDVPLTEEQMTELERHMEHCRLHPGEVTTLDEIKSRILGVTAQSRLERKLQQVLTVVRAANLTSNG